MISDIINSKKTLREKIEDLRTFSTDPGFLNVLVSPNEFLKDLILFVKLVFREFPPDSSFQFGQINDVRVFFIRLLSKLNYSDGITDESIVKEAFFLVYALLGNENIFNRYLSLRILYPLLRTSVPIDFIMHLKIINSFFITELPRASMNDLSKCELGFFTVAEALQYLKEFQQRYSLGVLLYDNIFASICTALHTYFGTHGILEVYRDNKKMICEYDSFAIKLLDFINVLEMHRDGHHMIYDYIPDLCGSLSVLCPSDCHYLRKEAARAIVDTLRTRRALFSSVERYFVKSPFTSVEHDPLKAYLLYKLCDVLAIFRDDHQADGAKCGTGPLYQKAGGSKGSVKNAPRHAVLSKNIFSELDLRISEYLPPYKNLDLISACLSTYTINLAFIRTHPMSPIELKMLVLRNLRHAHRIYKLIHLESNTINENLEEFELEPTTMGLVLFKLIEYIKAILQAISVLHLPSGILDIEDLIILREFLMFPLNDYSTYTADGADGDGCLVGRDYFPLFFSLPSDDLDQIIRSCSDDLLIKYHHVDRLWSSLTENFVCHLALIRSANRLIHRDLVFFNYKGMGFYEHVFPLAYGFFKLDKKHYKSDFTDLFSVIYNCTLEIRNSECHDAAGGCTGCKYCAGCSHAVLHRGAGPGPMGFFRILNKMFLEVKTCESAYTGLYFIYNGFERTVNELFYLYCLTHEPFYIECLFNIPVSLNLLVTKYAILIRPMQVALRSTRRLKEIVLKYIEYIIEFDNIDGLMDDLLIEMYKLLRDIDLRTMCVLSRISNIHRRALNGGEIKEMKMNDSHRIGLLWELKTDEGHTTKAHGGEPLLVNIGLDKPISSLIKNLIGYEYIYNFVDIRSNNVTSFCTRTLNAVEANVSSQDMSRTYLLKYLLNVLGYEERLFDYLEDGRGIDDVAEFRLNDVYLNGLEGGRGLDHHINMCCSASDILLALYIDESCISRRFVLVYVKIYAFHVYKRSGVVSSEDRVFTDVLVDAFLYAPERARSSVLYFYRVADEICGEGGVAAATDIKSRFVAERVGEMVNLVYLDDELKSLRALKAIHFYIESTTGCHEEGGCAGSSSFPLDDGICVIVLHALKYKLKRIQSFRVYELCVELTTLLFSKFGLRSRSYFARVFENNRCEFPYVKMLYSEAEFLFALNPTSDVLTELDRRCVLRILSFSRSVLLQYGNLVPLTEQLLKNIEKADTFAITKYARFLNKMACDKTKFNEILTPAKKYLPTVAVLEGFSSLESKRKFVETVNRNGHLQNNNPSSFKVFRNLFYRCDLSNSIKSNFIDIYNSQLYNNVHENKYSSIEHKSIIYDIILYCNEYDVATLDFILGKMADVSVIRSSGIDRNIREIFDVIYNRIAGKAPCADTPGAQPGINSDIVRYLVDHMHLYFVNLFVNYCIPPFVIVPFFTQWLNEFYYSVTASRTGTVLDHIVLSKNAFSILKYLKNNSIKYNNSKIILLIYRDLHLHYHEQSLDALTNWYFVSFTSEEIELLYRINSSFVVTSESLVDRIRDVEPAHIKLWLLGNIERAEDAHREDLPCAGCGDVPSSCRVRDESDASSDVHEDSESCAGSLVYQSQDVSSAESSEIESILVDNGDAADVSDDVSDVSVCSTRTSSASSSGEEMSNSNTDCGSADSGTKGNVDAADGRDAGDCGAGSGISLKEIIPLFKDNPLPVIELFCRMDCFSEELVFVCKNMIGDPSVRYIAVYYLCKFEPKPEYFSIVFKLNFQERSFAVKSLVLLVDEFGVDPFITTIKTVIRSEMRFTTSRYVLLPLIVSRPYIASSKEIFFELCVMACRMFSKGDINYDLLGIIDGGINGGAGGVVEADQSPTFGAVLRELNTLAILHELDTDAPRILYTCRLFDFGRVLEHRNSKAVLSYVNHRHGDGGSTADMAGVHDKMAELFRKNTDLDVSKGIIERLVRSDASFTELILLNSTVDNKMSALEIVLEDAGDSVCFLGLELLKEVAKAGYGDVHRFSDAFAVLVDRIPDQIAKWLVSAEPAVAYPPVYDFIPDLICRVDSLSAVSLCLRKFPDITKDQRNTNFLHLFRTYPHSLPFRSEFYDGCVSRNRIIRHSYVQLYLSQIPLDCFKTIEFVLRNDWSGVAEPTVDYLIALSFVYTLKATDSNRPQKESARFSERAYRYTNRGGAAHAGSLNDELTRDCLLFADFMGGFVSRNGLETFEVFSDLLFCCADSLSFITNFLLVIFKVLDGTLVHRLYRTFQASNFGNKIRMCFMEAFDSRNISSGDLYFNPFSPSPRYYLSIGDRTMYYGMLKSRGSLRETKVIAKLCMFKRYEQAVDKIFEVFKGVEKGNISYKKEDLRILEDELYFIYKERGVKHDGRSPGGCAGAADQGSGDGQADFAEDDIVFDGGTIIPQSNCLYSTFNKASTLELIDRQFSLLLGRIINNENTLPLKEDVMDLIRSIQSSLSIMCYFPRSSRIFSKLLLYSTICAEISESFIILKESQSDSIYGRFRMWMVRHPSITGDMVDWTVFMRWRLFIFNLALSSVSDSDKRKISSEICRLCCLYASKAFKEKLYSRASYILNGINTVPSIELQQNLQKYLLDIECLFEVGDYATAISLINSININRFSGEDRSRVYHWASRASRSLGKNAEADRFGALSRKMGDIIENKKEDLRVLRGSGGADYVGKLVEIINELPLDDSRLYVMELIESGDLSRLELVHPSKLYFFIPQIQNDAGFLLKNALLRSSLSSVRIFEGLVSRGRQHAEYRSLKEEFARLVNSKRADRDDRLKAVASQLFALETRYNFEFNYTPSILHSFETETALPGQFSYLRSEYDNIKVMSYVEGFYSTYNLVENIFYVRNTDGSLSKLQIRGDGTADGCVGVYSTFNQFMELVSTNIKSHDLIRLNFDVSVVPVINGLSVHSKADFSLDSAIKMQLFRKGVSLYQSIAEYFGDFRDRLVNFSSLATRWQDLLKREAVERLVTSNDFYMFRSRFISSYSSIVCVQYLLGMNEISLDRTFVEKISGKAYLVGGGSAGGGFVSKKFYLRPNIGYLFGDEGKNGPLVLILSRFAEAFLDDESNSRIVKFFFGDAKAAECEKKMGKLVFNGAEEGCNSVEMVIGEMVDPKTGLAIDPSLMPWL